MNDFRRNTLSAADGRAATVDKVAEPRDIQRQLARLRGAVDIMGNNVDSIEKKVAAVTCDMPPAPTEPVNPQRSPVTGLGNEIALLANTVESYSNRLNILTHNIEL